jgi:tetratricopeptide (TPR) repeat protein
MLDIARENFIKGNYNQAENILQQILPRNNRIPEVFQMLATIFYDRGKFNKAIKTFERALEIDPDYTDASVGLSIILNDLGRYDEGRKVFTEAQSRLEARKTKADPFVDQIIAKKHEELGDLYFENKRFAEALEEFQKSSKQISDRTEISLKIADSFLKLDRATEAVKLLKELLREAPHFIPGRVKLGLLYFDSNRVVEAVEQWENVLLRDPENREVKGYIRLAHETGVTVSPSRGVDLC